MSVHDLRCDRCGSAIGGPDQGVRFLYHPGDFLLKDDSGLLCLSCWQATTSWLGGQGAKNHCSVCALAVEHRSSLHIHRAGDPASWQLCRVHAVEFLNGLRTVEPKLELESFTLAADWPGRART